MLWCFDLYCINGIAVGGFVVGGAYGRGLVIVRGQRGDLDGSLSGSYVDDGKPEGKSTYGAGSLHGNFGIALPHDADLRATRAQ